MSRGPEPPRLDVGRLRIFSDFDGTITSTDTLVFLTERLGAGAEHCRATTRALHEGRVSHRDAVAADMATIRAPFAEAATLLRRHVRLDPGFAPFARWCTARRIPLTVLSAGFREIIALFLTREAFPDVAIEANSFEPGSWRCTFRDGSSLGHDKARAVRAARAEGGYTVYVGDGFSDREPAAVADEVFVRAGGSLAEHCAAEDVAYRSFETFDDVRRSLEDRLARPASSGGSS